MTAFGPSRTFRSRAELSAVGVQPEVSCRRPQKAAFDPIRTLGPKTSTFLLLDSVGQLLCMHERRQWNIKFANDAGGLKGQMCFASKFAYKALLDQSRSEA